MTNKDIVARNDITLINGKNVLTGEYEISQAFNKNFSEIVKKLRKQI